MKVRYVGEYPVIAAGLLWMPGEVKDLGEPIAHELLTNPNFVHEDVINTEIPEGESG